MEFLSSLVVNKPFNILIVAGLFFIGFLAMRFTGVGEGKNATALLVPTIGWTLYAVRPSGRQRPPVSGDSHRFSGPSAKVGMWECGHVGNDA